MTYEEAKMQIQAIPGKIWDQLSEPDREAMEMAFSALGTIDELYDILDSVCRRVRERHVSDDVCGLCQYDGAYIGETGDWYNECPGFVKDDCFVMENEIRKMCGRELIKDQNWEGEE